MAASDAEPLLRLTVGSQVNSVALSHDGMRVASGSVDHLVRIWDVHSGSLNLGPLSGHTDWVRSVAWSHDDSKLVSGSDDGTIIIWDARTGAPIRDPLRGHTDKIWSVSFSADSTRLASGSRDHTIHIWDAHTGALIGEPLRGHENWVYSVAFSSNDIYLVSGSYDKTIRIWSALTGAPVGKPLRGHSMSVYSVEFSHDGTRIVSSSADKTIRIWDVRTGISLSQPLRGHTDWVYSASFSPDSTQIVSGSSDNTIRVWDTRTGSLIGDALGKHSDKVLSVSFSPDSSCLASGSSDGTICIWKPPQSTPLLDMVTSDMSIEEIFDCLVQHGCTNLSSSLHDGQYASMPVANGGFGDVWRVTLSSGTVLAVKTLRLQTLLEGDTKGVKRAAREVHHWSKLQHANVQELLGIAIFQGGLGMVSLWLQQGNLRQYLIRNSEVERYPLCIQLATGVLYLHSVDMVHGDLKAVNVLVSDDGTLKINDFDYAILSDSTLRFSTTSRAGGGTLRWMAPELLQPGAGDKDGEAESVVRRTKETDIYALGMTMLEALTGNVPYSEYRSDMGVYKAIYARKPPKQPKGISVSDPRTVPMWHCLLKCWEHDPAARPDAASLLTLLNDIVA